MATERDLGSNLFFNLQGWVLVKIGADFRNGNGR